MATGENILLIRFKSIGDVLFTLPAVHAVRDNFPGARITFMVSKEHAALIEGFRDVDETLPMDRALYRRRNPRDIVVGTCSVLQRLRREKFSLVVDFQGYGETALLTWLTRAGRRWGNVYQPARAWAYTRAINFERGHHPADWNLSLLQQCGLTTGHVRNEFVLPEKHLQEARAFLVAQGLDVAKPTLFIQPFTSTPQKNWPLENFLLLADHWRTRGVQVLFGGGPAESAALKPVRKAGYPVSAGVSLLTTAGLMKLSTLVVGADTGLLHLAVALDKRVTMLMTQDKPVTTLPFQHPEWAVTPSNGRAGTALEPATVIEACTRALEDCAIRQPPQNDSYHA